MYYVNWGITNCEVDCIPRFCTVRKRGRGSYSAWHHQQTCWSGKLPHQVAKKFISKFIEALFWECRLNKKRISSHRSNRVGMADYPGSPSRQDPPSSSGNGGTLIVHKASVILCWRCCIKTECIPCGVVRHLLKNEILEVFCALMKF